MILASQPVTPSLLHGSCPLHPAGRTTHPVCLPRTPPSAQHPACCLPVSLFLRHPSSHRHPRSGLPAAHSCHRLLHPPRASSPPIVACTQLHARQRPTAALCSLPACLPSRVQQATKLHLPCHLSSLTAGGGGGGGDSRQAVGWAAGALVLLAPTSRRRCERLRRDMSCAPRSSCILPLHSLLTMAAVCGMFGRPAPRGAFGPRRGAVGLGNALYGDRGERIQTATRHVSYQVTRPLELGRNNSPLHSQTSSLFLCRTTHLDPARRTLNAAAAAAVAAAATTRATAAAAAAATLARARVCRWDCGGRHRPAG